jgi:hypothetical protein
VGHLVFGGAAEGSVSTALYEGSIQCVGRRSGWARDGLRTDGPQGEGEVRLQEGIIERTENQKSKRNLLKEGGDGVCVCVCVCVCVYAVRNVVKQSHDITHCCNGVWVVMCGLWVA